MAAPTTAPAPAPAAATASSAAAATSSGRTHLVFVDGTFGELVQELAEYLHVGDAVEPLVAKGKNEEALAAVVEASGALNAAPEKEFTGTYNLLIHLAINESPDPNLYLRTICQNLLKPVTSSPVNGVGLALNALQAVFNLLEPKNPLRYNVFMSILRFLRMHSLYDNIKATVPQLPGWLSDWDVNDEAQRKLYMELASFSADQGDTE